ncbi:MAG: hypothetical protein DRP63_05510 [Planctomycetota bacterium]|nr:MAG: hypothetical protein DRP63_05510 [Planctomycetota bacterium]
MRGKSGSREQRKVVRAKAGDGLSGYFFIDLCLDKLQFWVNHSFDVGSQGLPDPLKYMTLTVERARGAGEDADKLTCALTLNLFKGVKNPPFRLTVSMRAVYAIKGNPSLQPDEFLKFNAPAHIYSFMRELIFNITARGNTPPLLLPPLNFEKLLEGED